MNWIQFRKFNGGERVLMRQDRILKVFEVPEAGCCILSQEPEGILNTHVSDTIEEIVEQMNHTTPGRAD